MRITKHGIQLIKSPNFVIFVSLRGESKVFAER